MCLVQKKPDCRKMDDNHLSIKLGKNLVVWDLPKSPFINNSIIQKGTKWKIQLKKQI